MGVLQPWRMDASSSGATSSASFTSNGTYVAFVESGSITIGHLDSTGDFEKRCSALRPHAFGLNPILALSPLQTNLLAISTGSRTSIWDIKTDTLKHTIHASERSVTSAAWSNHDPDLIALGHIDGYVSLWNLGQFTRPRDVWSAGVAQCHFLSWSRASPSILAACCGQRVSIWNNSGSHESLTRSYDLDYRADYVLWRPQSFSNFLTAGPDGIIEEWSMSESNESQESSDCQDQDLFGDFEDFQRCRRSPATTGSIPTGCSIQVLGDTAVLVLAHNGRSLRLYENLHTAESDEPIWDKQLMGRCEYVVILPHQDTIDIAAVGYRGVERASIASVICEQLRGMSLNATSHDDIVQPPTKDPTAGLDKRASMRPIPISATVKPHKSHAKSRTTNLGMRSASYIRPVTAPSKQKNTKTHGAVSPRQAMASSLELPERYDEESPMPFLSPTIPSHRPSPSIIPTLSDDITLPPPGNESFGSLPSTAIDESDSDDETFDGDALKGSGTLMMPGGANVPLPKSCGAFFSPNGQLITYFPPKAKVRSNDIDGLSSSQPEERSTKASRLFPLFGNLAVEAHDYEDSDTESFSTQSDITSQGSPKAEIFSFSTPGEPSWTERLETLQALPQHTAGQQTVIISVRDVSEIIHFRPQLARSYQLSCDSEDTAGNASMKNAKIARSAGLDDLANVWDMLALLFQDNLPGDLLTGADVDIPKVAKRASRLLRTASGTRSSSLWQSGAFTMPLLSQSKAGAAWLVSQIFAWTELRADVQMLACISAVLLSSTQSAASKLLSDSRPDIPTLDYFVDGANHNSHPSARHTPILNAERRDGNLHQAAIKQPRSSQVSSRDPSQPTTPYVDSLSSTPPFPFPKLSRQGSRLSASGSASPEHHRSSFGAAAKFYAQSITDKISSYGTSPPARKFGTSPNNELSSSLPGGTSWSKSVSFASGVDYGSRASIRIAPDDDGYDSDRTIEDTSLPHTPKRYGGPVSFTLKNSGAFLPLKESQPYTQPRPTPLLSPSLAAKAKIWIGHYSEQLRRMGLQVQAAELDNIAGLQDSASSKPKPKKHTGITVTPIVPATKARKATCSLCYCKIQGVQQVCSQCLHTTHITCLSSFADACGDEDDMECPTGCGCVCSLVPFDETVWVASEEVPAPVVPAVRRKWSFTDPRRWREQVQGDSW